MSGESFLTKSAWFIRGWTVGYRTASKHAQWRPGLLLATALLIGSLSVGASLGFLWAAAEIFQRNLTGASITKTVLTKYDAWNRIYKEGR